MTTNDHIAAIKEHLKAIEAQKQPKKESKRYLVVELFGFTAALNGADIIADCNNYHAPFCYDTKMQYVLDAMTRRQRLEDVIRYGKIITINEE